jgi:hypothetical protein
MTRDDAKSNLVGRRKVQSGGTTQSPIPWDDAKSNPGFERHKVQLIEKKEVGGSSPESCHWVTLWTRRSGASIWLVPNICQVQRILTLLLLCFGLCVGHDSRLGLCVGRDSRLGLCVGPLVPSSSPSLMYSWPFRSFYYYSSPRLLTPNTASHLYVSPRLGYSTCPSSTLQVNIFKCNCHIINLL